MEFQTQALVNLKFNYIFHILVYPLPTWSTFTFCIRYISVLARDYSHWKPLRSLYPFQKRNQMLKKVERNLLFNISSGKGRKVSSDK